MKKQGFSTQVCGLAIGVAGALAPFVSAQAADELADRYINGYLNDPYTNEVAAERASVFPGDVKSIKTSDASGAQGPIRDDSAMSADKPKKQESFRQDQPLELYTGQTFDDSGKVRGAEGPIRTTPTTLEDKPMGQQQSDREWLERYSGS
ncbi:hypothetical protein [Azospira restricta]|uniref:Uncharacterized protein n=1 Tax=Azospira restricta TaxID=404405 RepID=A0A974PX32_9RHOO|nr:hypothetical protein [Azospira restricta]QRJ63088.1 hypothetical protein IWH25_15245 [Azospira restricta]